MILHTDFLTQSQSSYLLTCQWPWRTVLKSGTAPRRLGWATAAPCSRSRRHTSSLPLPAAAVRAEGRERSVRTGGLALSSLCREQGSTPVSDGCNCYFTSKNDDSGYSCQEGNFQRKTRKKCDAQGESNKAEGTARTNTRWWVPGVLEEQQGVQWLSLGKCLLNSSLGLAPPGSGGGDNRREEGTHSGWLRMGLVEVPLKLEGTSVSYLGFGFYLGVISRPLLS